MAPLEAVFVWISIALYGVSSALYMYAFVFKKARLLRPALLIVSSSFVSHTLAVLARYEAVGNLPVATSYEIGLGGSWVVMLFTLYISIRQRRLGGVGVLTAPFSLLMLGYGVMSTPELAPMPVSVRSFWLYIHVFFAWLAYGAFAMAAGLGAIYILKERAPKGEFYDRFPEISKIDDLVFKYVAFGFAADAVMIASGSIWAKSLWGNYWSWDPVEMWSLVTWLIYGLAIHLRLTMGWRGKRFAWVSVFALSGMVVTYFGINIFVESSLHFFGAGR